jgi:hypothetical protein
MPAIQVFSIYFIFRFTFDILREPVGGGVVRLVRVF